MPFRLSKDDVSQSLSPSPWIDLGFDEPVGALAQDAVTLEKGSSSAEDLDRRFKADPGLEHLVLVAEGKPRHLVTREHYYAVTGGPFGFAIFQRKPAESVAKADPLVVEEGLPARGLARRALEREAGDQYDPVLVVDQAGNLRGLVTMKQLILKASQLEIQVAQLSNPLTGLPSGRVIESWIEKGLEQDIGESLTVIFVDLDRFSEFNEAFGLLAGDRLVRRAAEVLATGLPALARGARLGHAGGDDFVIVSPRRISIDGLRRICEGFDREKLEVFDPADRDRGFFFAASAHGERGRLPLTTLSLAAVSSGGLGAVRHPALFSQAAAAVHRSAKALSEALGRSAFAFV